MRNRMHATVLRIFILLLSLLFLLSGCQSVGSVEIYCLTEKQVIENGELIDQYQFHYDDQGKVTEYYEKYREDPLKLRVSCSYAWNGTLRSYNAIFDDHSKTYDSKGNLLKEQRKDHIIYYTYNKQGKVAAETLEVGGEIQYETFYTYDDRGNCLSIKRYKDGKPYVGVHRSEYEEYDFYSYEYEYDSNDNRTTYMVYNGDTPLYRTTVTYNDNNLILSNCVFTFSSEVSINDYWEYDENGNLITEFREEVHKDGKKIQDYIYSYSYNANGKLIERRNYSYLSDFESVYTWTYDEAGKMTARTVSDATIEQAYSYTYDDAGNKLTERYIGKRRDSTDTISCLSTWAYDAEGRVVSEEYKWYTPTAHRYQHKYTYDEGGRLILWKTETSTGIVTQIIYTYRVIRVPAKHAERIQNQQAQIIDYVDAFLPRTF